MQEETGSSIETLIGKLAFSLTRAGFFLATAESCTGGIIASLCTDAPGSSDWFKGGIVAYANEIKTNMLKVPPKILEEHGSVSGAVVRRMALGVLDVCGVQVSVAVSGIAGPSGGTPTKPVGTVWIAVAVLEQEGVCMFNDTELARQLPGCSRVEAGERHAIVHAMRHHFGGTRTQVRQQASVRALRDIAVLLEENTIS